MKSKNVDFMISKLLRTELFALLGLYLMLYPFAGRYFDILWGIFAFFYLLYVPGHWLSYLFFKRYELGIWERWITSFALSFALILLGSMTSSFLIIRRDQIHVYIIVLLLVFFVFIVSVLKQ